MSLIDDPQVRRNVDRLPIEFDDYGFDRFGLSKKTLVRAYSPTFVAQTLEDEHPQTIALVLSQLPADRGAEVLGALEDALRSEVVIRLAELESVTTDVIGEVEEGVAELFGRPLGPETRVGGADAAAKVLNRVAKDDGSAILDGLDERDPELAGLIRNRMLTFNDLESLQLGEQQIERFMQI